jgi:hypothetical protein
MMTTTRALIGRVLRPFLKAAEGQPRRGPFHLPITGGWLSAEAGQYTNWWQLGFSPTSGERSAVVNVASRSTRKPGAHWRQNARGGRTRMQNSSLARVLHQPNDH